MDAVVPLLPLLALRVVATGLLVCAFALLGDALRPTTFAGLVSAAPSVALVGLTLTLLTKGAHDAQQSATAMSAGAGALVVYAAVVALLTLRGKVHGSLASFAALPVWAALGALAFVLLGSPHP